MAQARKLGETIDTLDKPVLLSWDDQNTIASIARRSMVQQAEPLDLGTWGLYCTHGNIQRLAWADFHTKGDL